MLKGFLELLDFLLSVAIFSTVTLAAALFVIIVGFTSIWTPWFYLTFAFSTLLSVILISMITHRT